MGKTKTGEVQSHLKSKVGAYESSFGDMPEKKAYVNPWMDVDAREELKDAIEKGINKVNKKALSTSTGGSGTAGNAMIPVYVDPRIIDTTRKYTPLVEAIPRVTNQGLTADYNQITSKGNAVTASEDAALSDQTDSTTRKSKSIKFVYSVGRVTGPARASYPSYILEGMQSEGSGLAGSTFSPQSAPNAKQLKVILRSRALREKEEDLILNGDSSTDSTEFDGIVAQQSTTNQVDKSSSAVGYDDVETAVRNAYDSSGRPNMATASSDVVSDLRKIMIDTFNYRPQDMAAELPFGVSSRVTLETMVGPVPVLPSQQLSNSSGSKQIFFLDMNHIEMRVLQDMTYEDLAKTNDSEKFMLKIYETLVVKNPSFNSFIDNIA